jgi:hypothetical protein
VRITPDLRGATPRVPNRRVADHQLLDEQTLRRGNAPVEGWAEHGRGAIDNIPSSRASNFHDRWRKFSCRCFVLDAVRAARDMDAGAQALDQKTSSRPDL